MHVQPYLFFNGRCEEALDFYRTVLDAKVDMMMRYRESPEPLPPDMLAPGMEEKVMHVTFRIGDSVVMASDAQSSGSAEFQGFSLSVSLADEAAVERVFKALADGGQIRMPLTKTFWSPRFGMVTDRFGVGWMVTVAE